MKKNKMGCLSLLFAGSVVLLQFLVLLALFIFLIIYFDQKVAYVYITLIILGIIEASIVLLKNNTPSFNVAWLIIMLIFPIIGCFVFLLWGKAGTSSFWSRESRKTIEKSLSLLEINIKVKNEFINRYPEKTRNLAILESNGFPIYNGTICKYFATGEEQFKELLKDLEMAQRFIFLEFFIISEGELWRKIYSILKQKAKQGIEIRILYDGLGNILTSPSKMIKSLRKNGIKVIPFNPIYRNLTRLYINFRNHQKIVIIDGNIGYTGGTNIADEYVNIIKRYGYWKDTAIKIEGDAVWSLSVIFLQMWNCEIKQKEEYIQYKPDKKIIGKGFLQPFADGPVNNPQNPALLIYYHIISNAKKYIYITTPYLVIEKGLTDALCLAAISGINVKIILPSVPDHWIVHMVTQYNYGRLLISGVKIYEYLPGYIHAKTIICDDDNAIMGSINIDNRSFYLHFENGIWICDDPILSCIKKDFNETLKESKQISFSEWNQRPILTKMIQKILNIFSPLM